MRLVTVCEVQLQDGSSFPLYRLQPKQLEAFQLTPLARRPDDPYPRHIGYGGAAGGGKSYLARAVGTTASLQWPGSTGVIFRETKDDVIKNHVNKFKDEVPEKLPDGRQLYSYNGEQMCATFVNGSRIYFSFLKEFDDVRRHHGNEYDWMIFEESTHYTFAMVRWLTGNRIRATVDDARPFALYPSNPGNQGHFWYKRLFIDRKYYEDMDEQPEDYAFVQAKVADNELLMDRDPGYLRMLNSLPEPHRSWMRDGDWTAGLGLALPMLDRSRHLVEPFKPPKHWTLYGAFDWGYSHPYSFGVYAVNEDRRHFKIETLTGRMQQPHEIAASIALGLKKLGLSMAHLRFVYAGHDCWADHKARGEETPTIAERLAQWGWKMLPANISRVAGLNNLRTFLSWEGVFPDGTDDMPYLMFMNTEGNRKCLECLEALPTDPDNVEDALKVDADSFGRGGDDMYDETRYAMAGRAMPARSQYSPSDSGAFSREAIRREHENQMRSGTPPMPGERRYAEHPEFGVYT